MKQEIQIADKLTLDEIKKILINDGIDGYGLKVIKRIVEANTARLTNDYCGLNAIRTAINDIGSNTGSGGGYYKPVQSVAVSNIQTLSFYGKGKIRIFTNAESGVIFIKSLDIDGLSDHMANVNAKFNNQIELEFDSRCIITLNCGGLFAFIYQYKYETI